MRRSPTVQQIADHLGLSKFSVSRALAGKSGVSEATRARVLQASTSLRARAQPGRQVLFVTQTGDGVSPELWLAVLHGAEREGARHGLTLIPRDAGHLGPLSALDPAVCGIVLATARPDIVAAEAHQVGLPAVTASYAGPAQQIDQVVTADWEAGVCVARYLIGLGHRSIGFVRGEAGLTGRRERLRGLRDGAAEFADVEVHEIGFAEPGGFPDAFRSVLRAGIAPTVLFCAHDGLAVTAISEMTRSGVQVPDDVSVIGFFDFAAATQIVPPLTTIRGPREQMGVALIRCLLHRIDGGADQMPTCRLALMGELVERESVAGPAPTDWVERFLLDGSSRQKPSRGDRRVFEEQRVHAAAIPDQ